MTHDSAVIIGLIGVAILMCSKDGREWLWGAFMFAVTLAILGWIAYMVFTSPIATAIVISAALVAFAISVKS